MGDELDNERLVLWGLVAALILLICTLVFQTLIVFKWVGNGGNGSDAVEAAGISTTSLALLAVIGVLSVFMKRMKGTD